MLALLTLLFYFISGNFLIIWIRYIELSTASNITAALTSRILECHYIILPITISKVSMPMNAFELLLRLLLLLLL